MTEQEQEQEQATFALPDGNTPEVQKAIDKQDGPPMLDWTDFGEVTARVTKVERTRVGKPPGVKVWGVVLSTKSDLTGQPYMIGEGESAVQKYRPGTDMFFLLPLGPGAYDGIENERTAVLTCFVRAIFNVPAEQRVNMANLEAVIEEGRIDDADSTKMRFVFKRRKQGQPKPWYDKKSKCMGEGLRQYSKDTIRPA